MEYILHLGYNLSYGECQKPLSIKEKTKINIQDQLKERFDIQVDIAKQEAGRTNNGNK